MTLDMVVNNAAYDKGYLVFTAPHRINMLVV
jgi:hypothetical protein